MEGLLEQIDPLNARQFYIAVKRLADSLSYGTDRSPFLGSGLEFFQSRPYQEGDPIKSIDWRVTARTGKLYIKEYETPKRLPCYLLIDTSASMMISSTAKSKYALALHIAGGLAFACLERVSPVGVLGVGETDFRIHPSLSKDQVMQWLVRLRRFRYDEQTTLGQRVAEFSPSLKNRALIIVLSDLHDPRAVPALKQLSQVHDTVVIQFRDPAEVHLKGAGLMRAQEAETGADFVTHGRQNWLDQEQIDFQLKRSGIDHLLIETDEPFVPQLRQFFSARDILSRGSR
ncbi:hypothetical protein Pan241w_20190 [Gimesia alba]|jgi:uncharacterized protein (DUF58 family)|uniref:DUF58 domain-containing protein n=2 Tax=Gimesia TaxID=1649453 RepID=A0A518IAE1_9PLAN|nr:MULTISPECIES: DUF58 domain-containing protein [Gimesia]QDT41939.1 hypothetical protein Pan241w_20190 [Gimesia alba]QDV50077.1 hypothetical protein Enr17x_21130 [Gimesia fumaroli]